MNAPSPSLYPPYSQSNRVFGTDHYPHLGSECKPEQEFLAWCHGHGMLTTGQQLLASVPTSGNQHLLGGTLGFLTHRQTQMVLTQWAQSGTDASLLSLVSLSQRLSLDFPAVRVPPPSQAISSLLYGQGLITKCYLAACLCTRRPAHTEESTKEAFAALKLWLLIRAWGFASMGAVHDQSIRSLSDHLRMALDGSFPGKLQKFVALLDSVGTPSQFEHLLIARLPVFVQGGDAWQLECSRAIQRLIKPERTRIPDLDGQVKITWPDVRPAVDQYPVKEWRELQPLAEKSPEDDVDAIGISESTDQNPSQRIRLSQSVALQGLEDRQYLAWSWNRLRGDEQQVLDTQLAVLLGGTDRTLKLMAALTRIALLTRNSLHTVLSIPLRTTVEEDWGCDVHGGSMHRCTPRRAVRWRSDPSCTPWISQLQPDWLIRLPDAIASPLREAFGRVRSATHLHDLWDVIDSPPARVFNEWCVATKGLERVSSGLLPAVAEQSVFNHSFDPVFSRLMTAPARAGISGAGAYPSWSMGAVGQAMQAIGTDWALKIGEPSVNGLGSELDPLDASISAAFDIARKRLESLDLQSNWIATHNRITGYTLAMLLAATGARPVNSMFESVTHFDFDNGRIYIEDKANSRGIAGPSGRVLPLPSQVSVWMQGCYLPHLQATAEYVSTAIPELGLEMCRQAQGHGSDKLPLFVFLRDIQGFDWQEVSEGALSALQLFDWPLPWNLFRHRMATRSRLLGMDPELVDAQLGHTEGGSETYGDWSPRCWADDESSWRSHIQRVFDLLAINPPRLPKIT